jgi:AcrR family transcriptional regulator
MATNAEKPRRRRLDGDASRQKILDAATEIAVERGYEGTSIGQVSERSGLPASSIYWYFKDKDGLIAAVIEQSFQTWLAGAGVDDEVDRDASVPEQLTGIMRRTGRALRESSGFLRLGLMLTLEKRREEPTARSLFLKVRQEALNRTIARYSTLFPSLDAAALHQLGTFTMAAVDGLFILGEVEGQTHDSDASFDLLATAVLSAARQLESRVDS